LDDFIHSYIIYFDSELIVINGRQTGLHFHTH
jgi:hypothetical protein